MVAKIDGWTETKGVAAGVADTSQRSQRNEGMGMIGANYRRMAAMHRLGELLAKLFGEGVAKPAITISKNR